MTVLQRVVDGIRRFRMCMKCGLVPGECGYTNKVLKHGNCVKVKEEKKNERHHK